MWRRARFDGGGPGQEVVEWASSPLGDQFQGFHRRLGLARLYEVDGGPAHGAVRHLPKAQAGVRACLFDRARLDLDAVAPAPPALGLGGGIWACFKFRHPVPTPTTPTLPPLKCVT